MLDPDLSETPWLSAVRRMIELQAAGPNARGALIAEVQSDSALMRQFAIDELTSRVCVHDVACKQELLGKLFGRATEGSVDRNQRVSAVEAIGLKIYEGASTDGPVNESVLRDLFELTGNVSEEVRAEAIQILNGYLLGPGSVKSTLPVFSAHGLQAIRKDLQNEAQRGHSDKQAGFRTAGRTADCSTGPVSADAADQPPLLSLRMVNSHW